MAQSAYAKAWCARNREKVRAYAHANYIRHRERKLAEKAEWRRKNPTYMSEYHAINAKKLEPALRDRTYKRKYGITLREYEMQLILQHGVCALCLRPPTKVRLAVDHNHRTGKIRGLLCLPCNRVIMGRIDCIPSFLERLIDYAK